MVNCCISISIDVTNRYVPYVKQHLASPKQRAVGAEATLYYTVGNEGCRLRDGREKVHGEQREAKERVMSYLYYI